MKYLHCFKFRAILYSYLSPEKKLNDSLQINDIFIVYFILRFIHFILGSDVYACICNICSRPRNVPVWL